MTRQEFTRKIRNSAKGKQCSFRIPGICNGNNETVVLCHAPDKHRGKAMKAPDYWGAYGCSDCHAALDLRHVQNAEQYWLQGILETQKQLVEAGLMIVAASEARPKNLTKRAMGPTAFQRQGGIARQIRG